jgi:hypothetical protein
VVWVRIERCKVGASMGWMLRVVRTHDMSIPRLGWVGLLLRVRGDIVSRSIGGNVHTA